MNLECLKRRRIAHFFDRPFSHWFKLQREVAHVNSNACILRTRRPTVCFCMRAGRALGMLMIVFNCAFAAENTNDQPVKLGAVLGDLLKRAVTNLTAPNSTSTNTPPIFESSAPTNAAAAAAIAPIPTDQLTAGLRPAL